MSYVQKVVIGDATLYQGDCMDILPTLGKVDHVITDPPYSARTHAGHDECKGLGRSLGYASLSESDCETLTQAYAAICDGWIVWMTDHTLAPSIERSMKAAGRYSFSPLPYYAPGSRVRLSGDGPSSWTDWIMVSRTARQVRWGTLPGGYMSVPGANDKARMGGKPSVLMESLVQDYSRPGETVLDSHMGAGTTGVACMRTGRKFIGCEIEADAFALSCKRIEQAHAQGQLFAPVQPQPTQMVIA